MLQREHVVNTGQVFWSKLVFIPGQHDAEQLRVWQPHAEVQHQMVVRYFEDLDHSAEKSVHVPDRSVRYIGGPESLVRSVDLDVVVVLPETLVPLQHEVSDAVSLLDVVLAVHVRRVGQLRVRSRRSWLVIFPGGRRFNGT